MNLYRSPYAGFPVLYPDVYPLPNLNRDDGDDSDDNDDDDDDEESFSSQKASNVWIYRRNFIGMLAFLGFFCAYMVRINLSVAIVEMTAWNPNITNGTAALSLTEDEKSTLLGSFFCGYVLTQIVGGWLSIKVGGAKVFGAGILVSSLLSAATPKLVPFGLVVFCLVRATQGFVQGATYPSMHAVWSRWAPPNERTRLASLGFSGAFMGTTATFPVCGYIGRYFGWPYMFYLPGGITCIWWLVWFIFVRDDPERDPWISDEELQYLRSQINNGEQKDMKHPWASFFISAPVWAIVVSHFCENWGFYTMITYLPSFLQETLKFEGTTSGVLSASPFLVMSIGLPISGLIVDKIRKTEIFSTTTIRKIFNCGAFLIQCGFMFMATRFQDPARLVICLTFAIGAGAFAWSGFGVNHLDIAPPHAGIIMGISNMMGTLAGFFGTKLVGFVAPHKQKTLDEWNTIFMVSSGFYLIGAVFYLFFGSGEKQSWVIESKPVPAKKAAATTVEDEDDEVTDMRT